MTTTLAQQFLSLGLRATAEQIDALASQAVTANWSPQQLLERITRLEADDRSNRSLERRTKRSRLGERTHVV